jgi:hypothetical protein
MAEGQSTQHAMPRAMWPLSFLVNLSTRARDLSESVQGPTLGVRFPKAKLNTLSTAAELVEHHPGRARVHGVVPVEPADRIERAILVVDKSSSISIRS